MSFPFDNKGMTNFLEYYDVPENEDGIPLFINNLFVAPSSENNDEVQTKAQEAFGIKYLYPWQRLVIANILDAVKSQEICKSVDEKKLTNNYSNEQLNQMLYDQDGNERGKQIVLLPTGAGKSLCFMVPALILDGPTLILYPLLALMSDQQRRMIEGKMIPVVFRGNQSSEERENNFKLLKQGAKVILANPEVLQSQNLISRLSKCNIKHIAIDEAHCVSEWGDTFRSSYKTLGDIIQKLGNPVVTAFTATASPSVLQRVAQLLFNGRAHILRSESDRPNIIYHVVKTATKEKTALLYAEKSAKPLLVFCSTRKRAENLARTFSEYFGYNKVKFYHAGLQKKEKDDTEKWFFPKKDAILCTTCAFGMGVDKKDIKTVIHLDPPPTAESYIQEAGRGGRDSSIANAILLWSDEDKQNAMKFNENSRQRVLEIFAESKECRRQILLDALGGEKVVCSGCDNCNKTHIPYAQDEEKALKYIKKYNKIYSASELEPMIQQELNHDQFLKHKINIWDFSDSATILKSLLRQKKIRVCKFPWKDKISF